MIERIHKHFTVGCRVVMVVTASHRHSMENGRLGSKSTFGFGVWTGAGTSVVCVGFFASFGSTRSAATASAAAPVRPMIHGVQLLCCRLSACSCSSRSCSRCCEATGTAETCPRVTSSGARNDYLAARSSSRSRSCFALRAAAPARPASTFFGSFDGREARVTHSTGALVAGAGNSTTLWLLLDACLLFSIVFVHDHRRTLMSKLGVLDSGQHRSHRCQEHAKTMV